MFSILVGAAAVSTAVSTAIYSFFSDKTKGDDQEQQSPPRPRPSPSPSGSNSRTYSTPSASTHAQPSYPSYQQPWIEPRTTQATANTKENLESSRHVYRYGLASSSRTVPTPAAQAQTPHPTQSTSSRVHPTTSARSDYLELLHGISRGTLTPSTSTYTPYTSQPTSTRAAQTKARTPTRTDYDNSLHHSDFASSLSVWESYQSTPTRTHASYLTQQTSARVSPTTSRTVRTPTVADYDDMEPSPYSYLRTPSPDTSRARVSRPTVSPKKHSRTLSSSSDSDYLGPSSRTRAVPRTRGNEVHDAIADAKDRKKAMDLRDRARRSARDMIDARDQAKRAQRMGDHEAKDEYGQEARSHESSKRNSDKHAARILFRVNNKVRTNDWHPLRLGVSSLDLFRHVTCCRLLRKEQSTFTICMSRRLWSMPRRKSSLLCIGTTKRSYSSSVCASCLSNK